MKYIYFSVPFLVVVGVMTSNFAIASRTFDRDLYFGLRGDVDVEYLQQILKDRGIYSGPVNGNFFALTRSAVQEFQKQQNIEPAAGYVGSKTRAILNQTMSAVPSTIQEQIAALLKQIESLQAQLTQQQLSETIIPEVVIPPITPSLPNPFVSTLKMKIDYPSVTLSRYSSVTLTEFTFLAQEKVAITRLKFKNGGTLGDVYFLNLEIVDPVNDRIVATASTTKDSYIEFKMNPDTAGIDKGVMISGKTYSIRADLLTPTSAEKPTIRLDLMSASDIDVFDYNDLTRVASITPSMVFPVFGPTIATF